MTSPLVDCTAPEMPLQPDQEGNFTQQPGSAVDETTTDGSYDYIRWEEMALVLLALLVWVAAILLFVHRWGKIRMLEPYLPDYREAAAQKAGGMLLDASPVVALSRLHSPMNPMVHCGHGHGSLACPHSQSTSLLLSHARRACILGNARKTRSADSLVIHSVHLQPPHSVL